jgi:hypothetical protein
MSAEDPKPGEGEEEKIRARLLQGVIPELVKRTFFAGLGAVFTTEEGIRKVVSEFSLPKDVATFLVAQAQGTKDELFRVVASELRGWLEKLNIQQELTRLLTTLSLEVKTEVRFIPNDQALVKPEIKRKVSIKRSSAEEGAKTSASDAAAASDEH